MMYSYAQLKISFVALLLCVDFSLLGAGLGIQKAEFSSGRRSLAIEVLDDDLLHFQLSEKRQAGGVDRIPATPMVARGDFPGPSSFSRDGYLLRSATTLWRVEASDLSIDVTDLRTGTVVARLTGAKMTEEAIRLKIARNSTRNVYGLGNFFTNVDTADGDWVGRHWWGVGMGNVRFNFHGFGPSFSQFPMMYALGNGNDSYGLFMDTPYRMSFNFEGDDWFMETWGEYIRGYVFTGRDVKEIRRSYMDLVGRPPVPPKSSLGLWVSKFGYDSWSEIWDELRSLRASGMPVDGFALDLQWFGGGFGDPGNDSFGSIRFDEGRFPNPGHEVDWLRNVEGINLMPIEEPYIDERRPEHRALQNGNCPAAGCQRYLVQAGPDTPVRFGNEHEPKWWGRGGMVDYSNPDGGIFWHNMKRHPLARMGILHHWNDLGEPEMFDPNGWYHGFEPGYHQHGDIHNLYGFGWARSIAAGYALPDNQRELQQRFGMEAPPRHFIMARAGAPGIHRFGAGMWSGDVARNAGSLRAHLNSQMHMSMVGMDGYNSDVGGFAKTPTGQEQGGRGEEDPRLYTEWFASSALGEYPLRPHGWAYGNEKTEFGPDRKGSPAANRANLIQRYEMIPYYYSLAHRAHRYAEPMFPPLSYHYQSDLGARELANVKMIGESLLYGVVVGFTEVSRRVYLPAGKWVNYHSLDWFAGRGAETQEIPAFRQRGSAEGALTLPLFAKAGAIIPKMIVDEQTMNTFGRRKDGSKRDHMVARVFADADESIFTVYEDDGVSLGYQRGKMLETTITQRLYDGSNETVKFRGTTGDGYQGAVWDREYVVELVVDDKIGQGVTLNGEGLHQVAGAFEVLTCPEDRLGCWANAGRNLVVAKSRRMNVRDEKAFRFALAATPNPSTSVYLACDNGRTVDGESIYAVGNLPQLGGWNVAHARKLAPSNYATWTAEVQDIPPGTTVEWKCIKREEGSATVLQWQEAPDNRLTTGSSGYAGVSRGTL